MTVIDGVIQVYAANEKEENNINVYIADGTCVGQNMVAAVLNGIAEVAAKYNNFVRVERYTMSSETIDISKYALLN